MIALLGGGWAFFLLFLTLALWPTDRQKCFGCGVWFDPRLEDRTDVCDGCAGRVR